jgi:hypothetical protein
VSEDRADEQCENDSTNRAEREVLEHTHSGDVEAFAKKIN